MLRLRLRPHQALDDDKRGPGQVVLVLPARDEAARIAAVIARLPATVAGRPTRCLVVDDASTDSTAEVARRAGATVVRPTGARGLGAAVRAGLREATELGAAVVAFCDADGEYDPAELERLVEPILAGRADYVVGSRFLGEIHRMLPHRRLGNRVLTTALRFVTRAPITDGQSGYRALSRRAAAAAEIPHDYNYAQVLTIDLIAKGFRYTEVPITYSFRESGRSFVRLGPYLRRVVPTVWRQLNPTPGPRHSRHPVAFVANSAEIAPGWRDERGQEVTVSSVTMPRARWLSTAPSAPDSTMLHTRT